MASFEWSFGVILCLGGRAMVIGCVAFAEEFTGGFDVNRFNESNGDFTYRWWTFVFIPGSKIAPACGLHADKSCG